MRSGWGQKQGQGPDGEELGGHGEEFDFMLKIIGSRAQLCF